MIDDPARSAGGQLGEYAYAGRGVVRERSMGEVVKDIISNVQDMVRSEFRLARAELREEAGRSASAAKLMAIGAGLALFASAFVLVSIAQVLAMFMPAWLATALVGVVLGIPGLVLLSKGRAQFTLPKPNKTIENVRENVEWIKNQTRS